MRASLRIAELLGLHHVRRHAQGLLVVRDPAKRLHFLRVQRGLLLRPIDHTSIVDGLLATDVLVVHAEGVEHLAECLVQAGAGLVHGVRSL